MGELTEGAIKQLDIACVSFFKNQKLSLKAKANDF